MPILDTNVVLRHLLQDHAEQSPRSTAYIRRIEDAEVHVVLTDLALFEVVFTLQRQRRVLRTDIRDKLIQLIELPALAITRKGLWRSVLELYARGGLSFPDAYHVELMRLQDDTEIISYDTDFDRVPGITRIEP